LVLKYLNTNYGIDISYLALFDYYILNNKIPETSDIKRLIHEHKENLKKFTNKNIHIPYTGSILITKDFIRKRYVPNRGYQSPFSYEIVIQLTFKEGKLVSSKNLSEVVKSIRERKIKRPEKINVLWDTDKDVSSNMNHLDLIP
jgi:hypothetical protein